MTDTVETEVAERFKRNAADHEMTVLHDDGLYRHVRFFRHAVNPNTGQRERSSFYWFELVTWPGSLTVNGDCGSYTFSRLNDMFEFFRHDRINPQYWAEKVKGEPRLSRYSSNRFRQFVMDVAAEREAEWPGLTAAIESEIFGDDSRWNSEYEEGAREALDDFEFGTTYTAKCLCGEQAKGLEYGAAENWRLNHKAPDNERCIRLPRAMITKVEGFTFTDTWEWDLGDWDWQYLWCCHAIIWGIGQYDALRAPQREAETAGAAS